MGDVERVLTGMVGGRPEAPGVVKADQDTVAVVLFHFVPVDVSAAGVNVDLGDVEFRDVERETASPR